MLRVVFQAALTTFATQAATWLWGQVRPALEAALSDAPVTIE